MTTNPESDQHHEDSQDYEQLTYRVSSTAAIGSLAIGVAYPGDGTLCIHLAEVLDRGIGTYSAVEETIDKESGKLVQQYSSGQWTEFTAALRRGEMSADLIV